MRNMLRVAVREYRENVQTKAFWLGIFILPALLGAGIALPLLFEKTKDARLYAVVDASGWLASEIDMRANSRDIAKLLVSMADRSSTDDLPDQARAISALMPEPDEARARELADALLGDGPPAAGIDDDARHEFGTWWNALSTKEAAGLDADLSRADFSRASVTDDASAIERLNADVAADRLFAYFVDL
ncbi:MAG: hypothetical protein ABGY41_18200, partial [Candidatus Poribacteria bacterium]